MDEIEILRPIIDRAERAIPKENGDFLGEDGLLRCGKCGQPKQTRIKFGSSREETVIPCACRCVVEQMEKEEKEKREKEDLERVNELRSASLLSEKFNDATFENFKVTKYNERNLKLCKRYATGFDEMYAKNQGLLMWGDFGRGKSFAAACIANYLLDRKVPVIMTSILNLIQAITEKDFNESEILGKLNRAKLVIFDDFGAERSSDYAIERTYSIIDTRYRSKKPMIITANMTLKEMQNETSVKYGRIYDRIFETCYPMQFTGYSWRQKEASRRFDEMEEFLNSGI